MNDSNRWEIDGDCTKCRKQSYCKKACKKNKESVQREIAQRITAKLLKAAEMVKEAK